MSKTKDSTLLNKKLLMLLKKNIYTYNIRYIHTDIPKNADYNRVLDLVAVLQCIVLLESKYFSHKDIEHTEFLASIIIYESICVLDKENISYKTMLKHILDDSKVLGLTVSHMEFLIDVLKTLIKLEVKFITEGRDFSYRINDLESLITKTYIRLKSVMGSRKIRDEFLFSLNLLYPFDKARALVDCFRTDELSDADTDVDKIKREKDRIKSNIKNFTEAPERSVTLESTKLEFFRIYDEASVKFYSIQKVNLDIKDLKNKLRKNRVTSLCIQKAVARSLRLLDLEYPKEVKPKKGRTKKNNKVKEVKLIDEFDEMDILEEIEKGYDTDSEGIYDSDHE